MIRWFLLAIALTGAAFRIYIWLEVQPGDPLASDYGTFFYASRLADDAIYTGPMYLFLYPPTFIAWLELVERLDFWTGYAVLTAASAGAFAWAVNRLGGWKVAALSFVSVPAVWGLVLGQTAMLLAAGLLWALTLSECRKGFVIGVLGAIKPQLFIAAPFVFIVRRDFKALFGMILGGVSAVLLATAAFGVTPWLEWLAFLPNARDYFHTYRIIGATITLAGKASANGFPTLPFIALGVALAGWIVSQARDADPLTLAAIIGGASVVASPYALPHDCIAVIPAVVAALLSSASIRSALAAGVYGGGALSVTLPLFLMIPRGVTARVSRSDNHPYKTETSPGSTARRAARTG